MANNKLPKKVQTAFDEVFKKAVEAKTHEEKDKADILKAINEDLLPKIKERLEKHEGFTPEYADVLKYEDMLQGIQKADVSKSLSDQIKDRINLQIQPDIDAASKDDFHADVDHYIDGEKVKTELTDRVKAAVDGLDYTDSGTKKEDLTKRIAETDLKKMQDNLVKAGFTKKSALRKAVFSTIRTAEHAEATPGSLAKDVIKQHEIHTKHSETLAKENPKKVADFRRDLKNPVDRVVGRQEILDEIEKALKEKHDKVNIAFADGASIDGAMTDLKEAADKILPRKSEINKNFVPKIVEKIAKELTVKKKDDGMEPNKLAATNAMTHLIHGEKSMSNDDRKKAREELIDHMAVETGLEKDKVKGIVEGKDKEANKNLNNTGVLNAGMKNPRTSLLVMLASVAAWFGLKKSGQQTETGPDGQEVPKEKSWVRKVAEVALPVVAITAGVLAVKGANQGGEKNFWQNLVKNSGMQQITR